MKAKGKFISFLLVVDTFFVAYAYGFHSRQVLVVDPKLPPVVQKEEKGKVEKKDSAGKAIQAVTAGAAKPLSKHESKKHELKKHESKKISANNDKSAKEQLAKNEKPLAAEKQTKAVSAKNKTSAAKSTKQATKQAEKKSP
ncbi:MAG: hypothetical protein WC028_20280 [Candidatus Obscuribacterales bacterium]